MSTFEKNKLKILDLTDGGNIENNEERDRKEVLVKQVLGLELFVFLLFGVLNTLVFDMYQVAFIDFIGSAFVLMILLFFHKTNRLFITLLLSVLTPMAGILFFLHVVNHQYYSLIWILVVPSGCVFLLGRKWGVIISLVFLVYIFCFILSSMNGWKVAEFDFNSVSNLIVVSVFLLMLVIYYEKSRIDMYGALHKKHQELKVISSTDSLTGIYNRRKIDSILEMELQALANHGKPLSVLLIDVDRFKFINDNYGHHVGDQTLVHIAKILKRSLDKKDSLGRWGGDEFMVVCPSTNSEQAQYKVDAILKKMEEPLVNDLRITISIGVGVCREKESKVKVLVRVDEALYRVKKLSHSSGKA